MEAVVARLESVAARLESAAQKMGAPVEEGETPIYVTAWTDICSNELATAVAAGKKIKVTKIMNLLKTSYENVGALIAASATSKKPSMPDMMAFLKPCSDAIAAGEKLKLKRDKKGTKDRGNHRAAVYECLTAMGWVTVVPPAGTPLGHVQAQLEATQFHTNRILKNDKADDTKAFIKGLTDLNKKVHSFVKDHFKMGLNWNPKGDDLSAASKDAPKAAAKAAAATEEKEPEKPKPAAPKEDAKKELKVGDKAALFGELSKGLKVTSGLKKVTKDMKTKYKKKEAGHGKVVMKSKKKASKPKKDPVTKNMGGRIMFMDYYEGIIKSEGVGLNMKTNAFISSCQDCAIEFKEKIKAVSLESCKKMRIYVGDVVSGIEMVNCKSVTIYCRGTIPSIQIDKCESPRIVVLKDAAYPVLTCSCISAGNVEVFSPTEEDPDRMVEFPMAEQFTMKVKFDEKKVPTGLSCDPLKHE